VLGYGVILSTLSLVLMATTTGEVRQYLALLSTYGILEGSVAWIFNTPLEPESFLAKAGLSPLWIYFLAAMGYSIACLGILYRRFRRLVV
jgi:hypothetical protein